jgi:ABC-2 type transport system permease protein
MRTRRIRAILQKELREYRRNRQIVISMVVLPLVFIIEPAIQIFSLPASSASSLSGQQPLVYMLAIPAIVPATVAAYSVAGERQQGSLEPVLTTPILAKEFLLGKALAALVPVLIVSYVVFGVFVGAIELFAHPQVASAVLQAPEVLAQIGFTPLVAGFSIWVGIAISARSSDPRVASQLSILASLPVIALAVLISTGVIHAGLVLVIVFGWVLLWIDAMAWRAVGPMFDRERLITGNRA